MASADDPLHDCRDPLAAGAGGHPRCRSDYSDAGFPLPDLGDRGYQHSGCGGCAVSGDTVLVTNGVYNTGGAVTPGYASMNRVVITGRIVLRSVNGPDVTTLVGQGPIGGSAVRGVCMYAGVLDGFTITNGPTMTSGIITDHPQFVSAATGDYRRAAGSPCIDAGANALVVGATDLDGRPRMIWGAVDMGAYESQPPAVDDTDGDGILDWRETPHDGGASHAPAEALCGNGAHTVKKAYIAGFNPTDSAVGSAVDSVHQAPEGLVISWEPVPGRVYDVLWTRDVNLEFALLESEIAHPRYSYTDSVHSTDE